MRGYDEKSGREGVNLLLGRKADFDILVCHNDLIAIGALDELYRHGIEVPGKVLLSGFDNMDVALCSRPEITSVHVKGFEMGHLAAIRLYAEIMGDEKRLQLLVEPQLIVRKSTQPETETNESAKHQSVKTARERQRP
jgi:LacI family transcriptional regulator